MSKEVAVINQKEVAEFRLFADNMDVRALVQSNLGGEKFDPGDLARISVPAGGGTTFEIPDAGGVYEAKKIPAIIVHVQPQRLYWERQYGDGEITPPDCVSIDLINGHGNPGGKCAECALNEFGSGRDGEGKACSERRNIYILTRDALLPYNLSAPVKSIANYRKYLVSLTQKGVNIKDVITIVGLEKDKNKSGIVYGKLTFELGPELSPEQKKSVSAFREGFVPIIEQSLQSPASYEVHAAEEAEAPSFT